MGFAVDNHLTPAGKAFLLGYMVNAAPGLAAQAIEHLKAMEADYRGPGDYWISEPRP